MICFDRSNAWNLLQLFFDFMLASAIIVLLMAGVFIVARVLRAVFRRRLPAKA